MIDDMLVDAVQQGYSSEDIKEAERINNGLYGLVKKSRSWFRLLLIHFSTER